MKKALVFIAIIGVIILAGLASQTAAAQEPTETPTPTITPTPTATPTGTPVPTIVWAEGLAPVDGDVEDAIEVLLLADPPDDATTYVYAVTGVEIDDTDVYVSLVNLEGVTPPASWTLDDHGVWMGSVLAVDDSGYTAEYYEATPPPGGGSGGVIVFPWRQGYKAIYGASGVHGGGGGISGGVGVDFLGGDGLGPNSMPPVAYAATAGTIDWICTDDNNTGVRLVGTVGTFYYLHLDPDNSGLIVGATFNQGQAIGNLVYGTFDDDCGAASQQATNYHLHFVFVPDGGYMRFEGCVLNTSSGQWVCGDQTIVPGGWLPVSGGGSGDYIDPGTGEDPAEDPINSVNYGIDHIWNGLVSGLVSFVADYVYPIFPEHDVIGLQTYVVNAIDNVMPIFMLLQNSQLVNFVPFFLILSLVLAEKVVLLIFVAYRTILRLIPAAA